jgi:hypothetical protein
LDKAGGFKNRPEDIDAFLTNIIRDKYYNDIRQQLDADPDCTHLLLTAASGLDFWNVISITLV